MPRDARTDRNKPPLIDDFAVQRAHGADLALLFHRMVEIEGTMPDGGRNRVKLAFASVPALLAMKGFAINDRLKQKDAYDIYYCVRNHAPGNPRALAEDCRLVLDTAEGGRGYGYIRENSMPLTVSDRPVSGALSKAPEFSKAVHRINGSRTPSAKSTSGCGRSDCGADDNGSIAPRPLRCLMSSHLLPADRHSLPPRPTSDRPQNVTRQSSGHSVRTRFSQLKASFGFIE